MTEKIKEIVRRYKMGDGDKNFLFKEILDFFRPKIKTMASKMFWLVGDGVEDVEQELSIALWRVLEKYDETKASLVTIFYIEAKNVLISIWRNFNFRCQTQNDEVLKLLNYVEEYEFYYEKLKEEIIGEYVGDEKKIVEGLLNGLRIKDIAEMLGYDYEKVRLKVCKLKNDLDFRLQVYELLSCLD